MRQHLAQLVAAAAPPYVRTGIDVVEAEGFAPLVGKRAALLTNQTGRDAMGRRTIDLLAHALHLETNAWAIERFGAARIAIERTTSGIGRVTVEPTPPVGD